MAIRQTHQLSLGLMQGSGFLGRAYTLTGRAAEACAYLERVAEQTPPDLRGLREMSRCDVALGEAYLHEGQKDRAGVAAGRAWDEAVRLGARGYQAWVQ